MTDPKVERLHRKADALHAAWLRRYGVAPAKHTVVLAMCPPSAETKLGDAWPGEFNWGATTFRQLNAAEAAAVKAAGVMPTVGTGHAERAAQAMAAIAAAGLPVASGELRGVKVPRSTIHCDSKTVLVNGAKVQQPYFVHFANFEDDTGGAEYYLTFVADPGNPARAVLENPKAGPANLAAAMYARGYFWGFKPHGVYMTAGVDGVMGTADDEKHDGNAENVAAYASWLAPHYATISAALQSWTPDTATSSPRPSDTEPAPPPPFDLTKLDDVQRALNALGCGRPPLKVDGNFATKSTAALGFYQGGTARLGKEDDPGIGLDEMLAVTGVVDDDTRATMRRDLERLGYEVL